MDAKSETTSIPSWHHSPLAQGRRAGDEGCERSAMIWSALPFDPSTVTHRTTFPLCAYVGEFLGQRKAPSTIHPFIHQNPIPTRHVSEGLRHRHSRRVSFAVALFSPLPISLRDSPSSCVLVLVLDDTATSTSTISLSTSTRGTHRARLQNA
jgi:hypothetical protein